MENFIFILEKAQQLIEDNCISKSDQKINYKSFDLSTGSYQECCQMLDDIENEISTRDPVPTPLPIYMLVNCAGMAICGK